MIACGLVTPSRAGAQPAGDDPLARARALEAQLAYDEALASVELAIRRGTASRAQLADMYFYAGRLAAGLDRAADAERHFAAALALRPSLSLPDGTSPKIAAPFEAARARSVPLTARLVLTRDVIAVEPVADPLGMIAGIAIRFTKDGRHDRRIDVNHLSIARDPAVTLVEIRAVDRYGNELWSAPPPDERRVEAPRPPPHDAPSPLARWSTWATVTGLALGAGAVAAWRFDLAQDEWNELRAQPGGAELTELRAVETRGRRWGTAANISFGVAAAAGIATIVFAVRGSSADDARGEPSLTLTPGPGAGLGVAHRF